MAFVVIIPDRVIAQTVIGRWARDGHLDVPCLASLSTDALPALDRLPADKRDCAAGQCRGSRMNAPVTCVRGTGMRATGLILAEDRLHRVLLRDEGELIAYLAENPSWARLVLRDAPDPGAAQRALREAAEAVWRIPNPFEPSVGLPNFCGVSIEDGLPVLSIDVKDSSDYAGRIAAAILGALDASGIGGRLEPFPIPFTPPEPTTPKTPYVRPEPTTVHGMIGRIMYDLPKAIPGGEWAHSLLPLRAERKGVSLPDLAPDERVEVDDAGLARLTERGHRDVDEHMRRWAALLAPFLDGIDPDRRAVVRDACLRMAGVDREMLAGWREYFGPLEPGEILTLETFHALDAARLGGMMPRRMSFDGRWLATLRLHRMGEAGMTDAELAEAVDDPDDWFDEGERGGALTRAGGVIRLTQRGHQAAAKYLAALGGDPEAMAMVCDACWWIVRNYRRPSP